MATWHDGRLLAYDCETTAPDPEVARIVQYAIGYVGGGRDTEIVAPLVNPGVEIPEGATEVHGITTERAVAEGRDAKEAAEILSGIIRATIEGGHPIVAFNARFDLTVLDRECRRHGVLVPEWDRALVVDPFVIDKWLHRYRKGSRQLVPQCEHYGRVFEAATGKSPRLLFEGDDHEAGADAIAAARLAWVIARYGEVVRRVRGRDEAIEKANLVRQWLAVRDDLHRLHAAQARWAVAEQIRLRGYFAEEAEKALAEGDAERRAEMLEAVASVREAWPVIPWQAQQELAA